MNILFFLLTFGCLHVSVDTHSLEYLFTAVSPNYTGFPEFTAVGLLDGKQYMSYSSSKMMLILEDWIKSNNSEKYWKSEAQNMQGYHDDFNNILTKVKNQFNHSRVHTLQRMFGCEIDDGTTRGNDQCGYDGEDFLRLVLENATWTAFKPEALILTSKWDSNDYTKPWKRFLEHDCIDWLNMVLTYGQETLERKVRPEASLFRKQASPEVVCHVTGFFPKALNITWQKDGEDVHEDVELGETLPNQDGSFQKRSILNVSAEDLQKYNYTCVIQHSSLEKEMVLEVQKGGGLIGIIIGVIVPLVFIAVVAVILVRKKNSGLCVDAAVTEVAGEELQKLNGNSSNGVPLAQRKDGT